MSEQNAMNNDVQVNCEISDAINAIDGHIAAIQDLINNQAQLKHDCDSQNKHKSETESHSTEVKNDQTLARGQTCESNNANDDSHQMTRDELVACNRALKSEIEYLNRKKRHYERMMNKYYDESSWWKRKSERSMKYAQHLEQLNKTAKHEFALANAQVASLQNVLIKRWRG